MNIYISNMGTRINNEELKKLFTPFGEVQSVEIMIDSFTDKSRGFGYVEMPQDDQARAAITALNQTEVNGWKLSVQECEAKIKQMGSYKVAGAGINEYRFKKN